MVRPSVVTEWSGVWEKSYTTYYIVAKAQEDGLVKKAYQDSADKLLNASQALVKTARSSHCPSYQTFSDGAERGVHRLRLTTDILAQLDVHLRTSPWLTPTGILPRMLLIRLD